MVSRGVQGCGPIRCMKSLLSMAGLVVALFLCMASGAHAEGFRFVVMSDTHVAPETGALQGHGMAFFPTPGNHEPLLIVDYSCES
jgi:hypothetical protein